MKTLIFILICYLMSLNYVLGQQLFYYAYDKKVELTHINNKLLVKLNNDITIINVSEFITTYYSELNKNEVVKIKQNIFVINIDDIVKITKIKDSLLNCVDIKTIYPFYNVENGGEVGISDEIIFRPKPITSEAEINQLNEKFKTKLIKKTRLYQVVEAPRGANTIELANKYYEEGLFIYACPSFFIIMDPFSNINDDEYFDKQLYLYPNPITNSAKINYDIFTDTYVNIDLYNLYGKKVLTVMNNIYNISGSYTIDIDVSNLLQGFYFLNFRAGKHIETKQMVITR